MTKHDPSLSYAGVNLFCSENRSGAMLLDMNGNVIHKLIDKRRVKKTWKLVEPCRDNGFVVLEHGLGNDIFLIDWDSNVKWQRSMWFHHDVSVTENGDVYAIRNEIAHVPRLSANEPIVDNRLVILTKDGDVRRELSFADMILRDGALADAARSQPERHYFYGKDGWDIFHTNSVAIVDRDVDAADEILFRRGDVLFCIRHLSIIGVIDIETQRIVWSWGVGELEWPHHPTLLEDGNILIFDNGVHRLYSRVIELNPVTGSIEWTYQADTPEDFYSETRGAAQRLPNGNTLITESDRGRVFEVTVEGDIVWEFFNTEIDKLQKKRAAIYRMTRMIDTKPTSQLRGHGQ